MKHGMRNANERAIWWFCSEKLRLSPQLNVDQHANMNATKICLSAVLQKACYHQALKSSSSSFKQECTNGNYAIKKESKTEYPL